jgi:PTS system mannose-specific IIA component
MTNQIILVAHETIGTSFLHVLENTFGQLPNCISAIDVPTKTRPETLVNELQNRISQFPANTNVLILTDLFGATPCNVVTHLKTEHPFQIITGFNLPMLIRALNYIELPLEELAEKAYSGAKDGIIKCKKLIADSKL